MVVMKIKKKKVQTLCCKKNLNCLEATQLQSKINHLQKYNLNVGNLRENHKELNILYYKNKKL